MNERLRAPIVKRNLYDRPVPDRVPVRTSAVNYYFLALFLSLAVFFVVWAVLHDGLDETPLIVAAIAAGLFLAAFVLFREVVLRRSRERAQAARRLSHHLHAARRLAPRQDDGNKLTIERNEELLREIRTKSEAAKVLGKFAEAHKEVFELCDGYLSLASSELAVVRAGSPRIPLIRKGTISAAKRHRFHLLKWAEIKARSFISEANLPGGATEKIGAAEAALEAVERAYSAYPEDNTLIGSRQLLHEFLTHAKARTNIESAETAAAEMNYKSAIRHYNDALSELRRYDVNFSERDAVCERIGTEIARLSKLSDLQDL